MAHVPYNLLINPGSINPNTKKPNQTPPERVRLHSINVETGVLSISSIHLDHQNDTNGGLIGVINKTRTTDVDNHFVVIGADLLIDTATGNPYLPPHYNSQIIDRTGQMILDESGFDTHGFVFSSRMATTINDVPAVAATASITRSGDPESYYPAQNATASITASNNNFTVDTLPVAAAGSIKFGANPDSTTSSDTTEYIQTVSNAGYTVKWFAVTGATNGQNLSGYPANSRAYDRKGTAELTCAQFIEAVNTNGSSFWDGPDVTGGVEPGGQVGVDPAIVATFIGSTNNPTAASLTKGAGMPAGVAIVDMNGGVDANVVTHN